MDWNWWLNNPWIIGIGIGSGVPSGLLVTWLSRILLSKNGNKEYRQKVAGANREIIYAIRPGVSEGLIPSYEVVAALINSTSRKFSVETLDIYSSVELAEELIKEVMDSTFISSVKKAEYCKKLSELMQLSPVQSSSEVAKIDYIKEQANKVSEYRRRTTKLVSMIMGMITLTMSAFMTIMLTREGHFVIEASIDRILSTTVLPALAAMLGLITSLVFTMGWSRISGKEKKYGKIKSDSNTIKQCP